MNLRRLEQSSPRVCSELVKGQKVRFRSWEDMEEQYGLDNTETFVNVEHHFTRDMNTELRGTYIIREIYSDGSVTLDPKPDYHIHKDMLEPDFT